jgi:transposase
LVNAPAESPLSPTLPTDLAAAHAMILAERQARIEAQAEALAAKAAASSTEVTIAHLKLMIEKLKRELYGQRSERTGAVSSTRWSFSSRSWRKATEDEIAAEATVAPGVAAAGPAPSPRPQALPGASAARARRDCSADVVPVLRLHEAVEARRGRDRDPGGRCRGQWKVIQTVRERFSCRQCEAITQPPAPFHVTPRGFAGPNLLAMILYEKFGQHQPLNRQSERYGREGIDLSCLDARRPGRRGDFGACAVA